MNLTEQVNEGDALRVRDAFGEWHDAIATSSIEGTHRDGHKIHSFPVIWAQFSPGHTSAPWPVEDVEFADAEPIGGEQG